MRRGSASHKGQSLIEFALVLPILLIITFGIIEFGMMLYNQQIITNASREGARAGIVASVPRAPPPGASSIDSVVQQYCANHLITFGAQNLQSRWSATTAKRVQEILQVEVSYQYSFLISEPLSGLSKVRTCKPLR